MRYTSYKLHTLELEIDVVDFLVKLHPSSRYAQKHHHSSDPTSCWCFFPRVSKPDNYFTVSEKHSIHPVTPSPFHHRAYHYSDAGISFNMYTPDEGAYYVIPGP